MAGMVVGFFVGPLLDIAFVMLLRSFGFSLVLFSFEWLAITGIIIGTIIGGFVGYGLYTRSKYAKIAYYDPFA
ncbi:MAG: hypothetical protein ABSD42_11935 [Candidatus Bathyarchaeia archaeon]